MTRPMAGSEGAVSRSIAERNPIKAFRGRGKGGGTSRLLADRRSEQAGANLTHENPEFTPLDISQRPLPFKAG